MARRAIVPLVPPAGTPSLASAAPDPLAMTASAAPSLASPPPKAPGRLPPVADEGLEAWGEEAPDALMESELPPVASSTVGAPAAGTAEPASGYWRAWRVTAPTGEGWQRQWCPRCTHAEVLTEADPRTLLVLAEGPFYCVRCGHHGNGTVALDRYPSRGQPRLDALFSQPLTYPLTLEEVWASWGLNGGVTQTYVPTAQLGEAFFKERNQWAPAVLIPVHAVPGGPVVDVVQLELSADSGQLLGEQRAEGGQRWPWGWADLTQQRVVMVDHFQDALALMSAGESDVVALPTTMNPARAGGGEWSTLGLIEEALKPMGEIVIVFRDDDVSHRFEEELGRRFGRERCLRVRWQHHAVPQTIASAVEVLRHFGEEGLREAMSLATPFPVAGVHELVDVNDRFELLYEFGLQPGVTTGWPTLDLHYTVKPGQWTVVTGIPGHGKSTFLDALMVHIAQMHGWRFGVFSPENQPIERHFANLMEKVSGLPFNKGYHERISPAQKDQHKGFLNDHFKIILPEDDHESQNQWTIDGVLELARVLVYRYGIRGLVIDPWNELDHQRSMALTESEYISQALTKVRRFARLYSVHVWIVAHPTKLEPRADGKYPVPTPYMISGGAHWRNKADNAISIFRNVGDEDEDVTDVHVQKIRFKEVGRPGLVSLRHDVICGRYYDDLDQAKRSSALAKGLTLTSKELRTTLRIYDHQGMTACALHDDPLRSPYD